MNYSSSGLKILVSCALILISLKISAQDPVFSQFYNSAVYLNPALVGEEENVFFNFAHRSQWRNLQFPYSTEQVSLIVPYFKDKHNRPEGHLGGLGFSFYNDRAGESNNLKSYGGNVNFAYNLHFSGKTTNRLTFAMQAGFISKRTDKDKLEWGEQYNPFIGFDNTIVPADLDQIQDRTFLDIGAGAFWRYYASNENALIKSIYAGYVSNHLNHPDESILEGEENRLPVLHKLHGGVIVSLSEKTAISGNVLSQFQDMENETNFGAFLSYLLPVNTSGQLSGLLTRVGTWYRFDDSFIASIEFQTNHLQFGFSYDWNSTSLRYNHRGTGSYEFSMGYRFYKPAAPKIRY